MFAQAPGDILESLAYPGSLPRQSSGEFLEFMLSTCQRENELRAEESRALWIRTIHVKDKQRDRIDRNAGRARYASAREVVME